MPTPEQPSPDPETLTGMPDAQTKPEEQRFRTIAVRVEEGVHSQLSFIAQLSRSSLSDEIRTAIGVRIATAQNDADLIARAQEAREAIEREAAARSAAISGFMGAQATGGATKLPRRASKRTEPNG